MFQPGPSWVQSLRLAGLVMMTVTGLFINGPDRTKSLVPDNHNKQNKNNIMTSTILDLYPKPNTSKTLSKLESLIILYLFFFSIL